MVYTTRYLDRITCAASTFNFSQKIIPASFSFSNQCTSRMKGMTGRSCINEGFFPKCKDNYFLFSVGNTQSLLWAHPCIRFLSWYFVTLLITILYQLRTCLTNFFIFQVDRLLQIGSALLVCPLLIAGLEELNLAVRFVHALFKIGTDSAHCSVGNRLCLLGFAVCVKFEFFITSLVGPRVKFFHQWLMHLSVVKTIEWNFHTKEHEIFSCQGFPPLARLRASYRTSSHFQSTNVAKFSQYDFSFIMTYVKCIEIGPAEKIHISVKNERMCFLIGVNYAHFR